MLIQINADYFHRLSTVASKEDTRYYLNGICIRPHWDQGAFLIATDGHRLGMYHDESALVDFEGAARSSVTGQGEIILSCRENKDFVKNCKPARKDPSPRVVRITGDTESTAQVSVGFYSAECDEFTPIATFPSLLIDGVFPDVNRIIPTLDQDQPSFSVFNAKYLGDFAAFTLNRGKGCISIMANDPGSPAIVKTDDLSFFGVIMPMRGPDRQIYVDHPSWMHEPAPVENCEPLEVIAFPMAAD